MGNWQANHQLKLHSQSETEQCTRHSGPQVDGRVIAVTLCLICATFLVPQARDTRNVPAIAATDIPYSSLTPWN